MALPLCAILVLVSLFFSKAQSGIPDNHVALYVFGDSLYDTGMGLYGKIGPAAKSSPYGMTYFKRPAGRFSDGRVISDFIAQYANLSFPQPYLRKGFNNFTEAVNFADCSSGVLVETRPNTLNLKLQVNYFVQMVQKLEQEIGQEETSKVVSNAVYLLNTGANDYADLYNLNTKPLSASLKSLRLNQVIGNLSTHITTIYNQGGRKFGYQNVAPMGCLPAYLEPNGSCTQELNELARMHNDGFATLAQKLQSQLPGFKYSIYDFYTSLSARLVNGTSYGFKESQSACCGSGPFNGKFTCQNKGKFTVCSNPTDYLWFDAGHPTEKADEQFSQEFWNGSSDIVAPYNIKNLYDMH